MDACSRVFHADGLWTAGLLVDFNAAEAREDVRNLAVDEAGPVELGFDLDCQAQTPPGWQQLAVIGQ